VAFPGPVTFEYDARVMPFDPPVDARFASHPTLQRFTLEPMKATHLDEVVAIEALSFEAPWPRAAFERELSLAHAHPLVCLAHGQVVGYVCPWLISDEVQILRLAVAPSQRRRGAAATLLRAVMDQAYDAGAHWLYLEVEEGNHPAESLYQGMGFTIDAVRPDYYGRGRHALVMVLDLDSEWNGDEV